MFINRVLAYEGGVEVSVRHNFELYLQPNIILSIALFSNREGLGTSL